MAYLKISIAELADLMSSNELLNSFITDFRMEGDYLSFNFYTRQFFPKYIPVSLLFISYSSGQIVMEISTNWMSDKFLKLLPVKNSKFLSLKFPKVIINLHNITEKYLNGILVENIDFLNGAFEVKFTSRKLLTDNSINNKQK